MNVIIETERLAIEPLQISDKLFILKLLNTEGWLTNIGYRNVNNAEDASMYIQKILDNTNYFCHVFKLKQTQEPLGIVTFIFRDNQKHPDIGFAMLPEYEKKGYAYEATKGYLNEIVRKGRFEKILGITSPANTNSQRLLEKLGLNFQEKSIQENAELLIYSLPLK
jgi:RimJ/RimL family protein N-acetyltransferase